MGKGSAKRAWYNNAQAMSDKYDSFRPRRGASVDGFLVGPGQRPRQPQFRTPPQQGPAPSTGSLEVPVELPGIPRFTPPPKPQAAVHPNAPTTDPVSSRDSAESLVGTDSSQPPRQSWSERRRSRKQNRKKRPKRWLRRILKILGIVLLIGILIFGAKFYRNIAKLTGNSNPFSLIGVFRPSELKNENGRVNILVAGNSADDVGHNGGELTDSIMLLSIDTKSNTALMLSIPRDLWVSAPEGGHTKINAIYPSSGMSGLASVVEEVTGLPVHYDALVNYSAFRDLVNAVGGITITVKSENPKGIYDSSLDYTSRNCCALAKYPNGPASLDGKQALNLARARGEGYGSYGFVSADYTRTQHQRQMLLAIKSKAVQPSVIANPFKISSLVDAVGKNVKTDLQISELQTLFYYAKKIDNAKIDSYNIDTLKGGSTHMLIGDMIAGQSVQIPAAGVDDFSDIQLQLKKVFSAGPLVKENAGVVILNATDAVGLAKQQKAKLFNQGANILLVGDAVVNQDATTIVDNSQGQKPNTLAYLKKTYNATVVVDPTLTANYPAADFILVLGESALPKTSTTTQAN